MQPAPHPPGKGIHVEGSRVELLPNYGLQSSALDQPCTHDALPQHQHGPNRIPDDDAKCGQHQASAMAQRLHDPRAATSLINVARAAFAAEAAAAGQQGTSSPRCPTCKFLK